MCWRSIDPCLRTARYDDDAEEVEFGEISVFLSPTFVIAVRQGVASDLREARQRLEQRPELLAVGSSSALWAIMDQVVDGYAPVVAGLEHDIDQIEATVFSGAIAPTERIYSLRNEATDFYRAVHPLLAVTAIIERAAHKKLRPYFRDVRDHLLLVDEEITDQRDCSATVLQANMAVISVEQTKVSVQQNSTIEQLTILATVFLPLTFVTGFFGQNFGWLVRHIDGPNDFSPTASAAWWCRWCCCSVAEAACSTRRCCRRRAARPLTAPPVHGRGLRIVTLRPALLLDVRDRGRDARQVTREGPAMLRGRRFIPLAVRHGPGGRPGGHHPGGQRRRGPTAAAAPVRPGRRPTSTWPGRTAWARRRTPDPRSGTRWPAACSPTSTSPRSTTPT